MATNNLRNFENNVKNNKKNYNKYANKLLNIVRKFETNQNKIEKIHKSINALAGRFKNAHGNRVGNKKLAVIVNGKVEYPIRAWGKLLQKQNNALITQNIAATKVENVLVNPNAATVTQANNTNRKTREAAEAAAKAATALKKSVNNAGMRVGRNNNNAKPNNNSGSLFSNSNNKGNLGNLNNNNANNNRRQVINPLYNSNAVNNLANQVASIPAAAANVINKGGTPNAAINAANRVLNAAKNNAKNLKQNNNNAAVNTVVNELVNNAEQVNKGVNGAINATVTNNTANKNNNLNKIKSGLRKVNRSNMANRFAANMGR
tara:strand:- start:362 stop:1318 length:957 start_codon:yes stop_codon:yes gene_type:complete